MTISFRKLLLKENLQTPLLSNFFDFGLIFWCYFVEISRFFRKCWALIRCSKNYEALWKYRHLKWYVILYGSILTAITLWLHLFYKDAQVRWPLRSWDSELDFSQVMAKKKLGICDWGGATLKGALLAVKKMPSWTGLVHSSKRICLLVNDNQILFSSVDKLGRFSWYNMIQYDT